MKKNLKTLLTVLGCTLLLSACGNKQTGTDQSGNNNAQKGSSIFDVATGDDVVSIDKVQVKEPDTVTPIVPKTCEEISRGTCGGSLTDFMVGSYIEPLCTYTCSFTHTQSMSGEYTVKSDDRGIAQVSHEAGSGIFTVKGITPGDAIIQAITDENEVVLQFVVHVRSRLSMEAVQDEMYKTNVYYGMFYGYRLSFTELNPIKK